MNPRTEISAGLPAADLDAIERQYGFEFADDHRAFLAAILPVGPRWPDWRSGDETALRKQLSHPVDGVLFDVENNNVWAVEWGPRPALLADALVVARGRLASVPQLVPVYGHRYLPSGRGSAGHPVLSVYQTDIIYYGVDLVDYIYQEFRAGPGVGVKILAGAPEPRCRSGASSLSSRLSRATSALRRRAVHDLLWLIRRS